MLRVYGSFRRDVIGSEEVAPFEGLSPQFYTACGIYANCAPLKLPGLRLQRVASASDSEDPLEYSISRRVNPDAQCAGPEVFETAIFSSRMSQYCFWN